MTEDKPVGGDTKLDERLEDESERVSRFENPLAIDAEESPLLKPMLLIIMLVEGTTERLAENPIDETPDGLGESEMLGVPLARDIEADPLLGTALLRDTAVVENNEEPNDREFAGTLNIIEEAKLDAGLLIDSAIVDDAVNDSNSEILP